MAPPLTARQRLDHLFKVVTNPRFLSKEGLGNEVPFFICPYPACEGISMNCHRKNLVDRAKRTGIDILDLNLYKISLDMLEDRGVLKKMIEIEQKTSKSELKELLQGLLDSETHLVPRISQAMKDKKHDVMFLSGVGEVFPYIRSHNVLNNLQSVAKDKPTVLFFPGEYSHSSTTGASLNLFGVLHDDRYYRAFNILNYRISSDDS